MPARGDARAWTIARQRVRMPRSCRDAFKLRPRNRNTCREPRNFKLMRLWKERHEEMFQEHFERRGLVFSHCWEDLFIASFYNCSYIEDSKAGGVVSWAAACHFLVRLDLKM